MSKKILIAAVTLAASGAVMAEGIYSALDTDKNGVISQSEAAAVPSLVKQWKKLDVDGNGELTSEEFAKFETSDMPSTDGQESK